MKTYLDRLNLRPFEKRLVVGVGVILFIVFNLWFVVPHFSDWGNAKFRMEKARRTLQTFQTEIQQTPKYKKRIEDLKSENFDVPPEDQALNFASAVQSQAAASGVNITQTSKTFSSTNQFFLKQTQTIGIMAKESQLVDFLFRLGSGNSLIRVQDLSLHTDPPRQSLVGSVKLVASYQKKVPARAATSAAPGSRPVRTAPGGPGAQPATPISK